MNGMPSERELLSFAVLVWSSLVILLGVASRLVIRARREGRSTIGRSHPL